MTKKWKSFFKNYPAVLDKLCNKKNEDDDWDPKAKQENPELEEEVLGFLFSHLEFFLG